MTITGRPDTNNSNAVTLNSPIAAAAGGLATVMLEDIEFVYDNGGNNTIELDNDRTPAADSDAYVNLNDGDDSLTVTNVDELTVEALSRDQDGECWRRQPLQRQRLHLYRRLEHRQWGG